MLTISQHVRMFDSHDGEYGLVCHDISRNGTLIGSAWCPEKCWVPDESGVLQPVEASWNYQLAEAFCAYDIYIIGRASSRDEAFAEMIKMADDAIAETAARAEAELAIAAEVASLKDATAVELMVTEWRGSAPGAWAIRRIDAEHREQSRGRGSASLTGADTKNLVSCLIREARNAW